MSKLEPKNGEWWLCTIGDKPTMALFRSGGIWWQEQETVFQIKSRVKPLHRLFIQGDNITTIEDAEDVISRVQEARRVNQERPPAAINGDDALWLVAGNMLDQAQAEIDRLNDVVTELTCELIEVDYDS